MSYIRAIDVNYKGAKVLKVLQDGGPSKDGNSTYSIALIEWHGNTVVAMRWNGKENGSPGYPSVGTTPTWLILPKEVVDGSVGRDLLESIYDRKTSK